MLTAVFFSLYLLFSLELLVFFAFSTGLEIFLTILKFCLRKVSTLGLRIAFCLLGLDKTSVLCQSILKLQISESLHSKPFFSSKLIQLPKFPTNRTSLPVMLGKAITIANITTCSMFNFSTTDSNR